MRLAIRFRRAVVFGVAATTVASGLTLTSLTLPAAHAGDNNVQPPVDACFSQAGYCDDAFMKAAIAPTTVTTPVSETDTTATFTFTSPSAGTDTHDPVACGDAGCLYNHYDWNAYAQFNHFQVVSGCGSDNDTCTVSIARGRNDWVPLVASLNDYPTALWLMWVPAITTGQVSGVVADGLGHGVPNVTVNITGPNTNATGQTGSDGSYLWIVRPGSYVVTVSDANKDVFAPSPATVAISTTPSVLNFALALHTVSGKIISHACTVNSCPTVGVPNIAVAVVGTTSVGTAVNLSATSTSSGAWSARVPSGSYTETPKKGNAEFDPPELAVDPTADVGGQNFFVCSSALAAATGKGLVAASKKKICPYGADWTMPSRLKETSPNSWTSYQWGILRNKDVYPADFVADVFLTQGNAKVGTCAKDVTWTWTITRSAPNSKGAKFRKNTGCEVELLTPTLGTFTVDAEAVSKKTHKVVTRLSHPMKVVVKDWLIGAVGDSNGSGEGNPPFFNTQCNRSEDSYQFKTALQLEKADDRTSVTFVWASCSGAQVEDLVSRSYVGIKAGEPMPPQLKQLEDRADPIDPKRVKRKYDGVLSSIGVNNLSFGGVLKYCALTTIAEKASDALRISQSENTALPRVWTGCMDQPVQPERDSNGTTTFADPDNTSGRHPTLNTYVRGKLTQLVGQYASFKNGLRADLKGTQPAHVLMTTYPDFSTASDGSLCGHSDENYSSDTFPPFTTAEWGWLSDMGVLLNKRVDQTKGADGFTPVDGIAGEFLHHGYCAQVPYIRTVAVAKWKGNGDGPFHPTEVGHQLAANHNFPALCGVLYKNTDCASDNPNAQS